MLKHFINMLKHFIYNDSLSSLADDYYTWPLPFNDFYNLYKNIDVDVFVVVAVVVAAES